MNILRNIPPTARRWVYGVAAAALPVLVYYDLVSLEASPLWLAFVLALANVTAAPDEQPDPPKRAAD